MEFLRKQARGVILDLGGGVGAYACVLRELGHQVTLAEISSESLESARRNGLETVDMNVTPWAELMDRFDTIQMVEVLEHVENPAEFLGQVLACTRQQVLLTVPCSNDFQELFGWNLTYNHIAVSDHLWHFTDNEVRALFPVGWKVEIELVDHLGPQIWLQLLGQSCRSRRMWLLASYPLRALQRRGYFAKRFPTRMLVKATRE